MTQAPTLEEILSVMSAAAGGDTAARVTVAQNSGQEDVATRFAVALNRLLDDLATRAVEQKNLEEQVHHAQKMEAIGQLAGGVAHDFNNILSVILSYTTLVLDDLKPSDPMREDLQEVKAAAERASGLTHQLVAFSRQQMLEPKVLDLNQVVTDMKTVLQRLLGEQIALSIFEGDHLGKVYADPSRIEEVLTHLVANAREAMTGGGVLSIKTTNLELDAAGTEHHPGVISGSYVVVEVTDTGTGMGPETRARLFEPFFTTKQKGKGTGLGLATVFGIVKQSGGHIRVFSEPGSGTTFWVYLPRTDRSAITASPSKNTRPQRGSETVLLVDDEDQVRALVREILDRHGYNVLEAQNGGEAFLICEQYPDSIDLLLTDVVMPRMSGRALAQRLAPMRPEMRVLFMSGYTDDASVHDGVFDAAIAFLQKPITPEALLQKVRHVLDSQS